MVRDVGAGAPGQEERPGRRRGVDDAEEAEDGRREERERAPHEASVEEIRDRGAPDHGRDDEAVAEERQRAQRLAGLAAGRRGAGREERPGLESRDERERRQRRDRDGGRVAGRGRGERLRENLDADVDQDRRDRRGGDPVHEERQVPEDPAEADEESRRHGIARARAHLLVGGVSDVRRRLDDAAAEPGRHRAEALRREDRAGVVRVARGRRALRVVDASDDRRESERQRDREVHPREGQSAQEREARPRDGEVQRRGRVDDRREERAVEAGGRSAHETATAATTETNAPGSPPGSRTRPKSVIKMMPSPTKPTIGSAKTLRRGSRPMSAIPAPPIEPRRAARGSAERTALPDSARPVLKRPTRTVTAIPIFQERTASPVAR